MPYTPYCRKVLHFRKTPLPMKKGEITIQSDVFWKEFPL